MVDLVECPRALRLFVFVRPPNHHEVHVGHRQREVTTDNDAFVENAVEEVEQGEGLGGIQVVVRQQVWM